MCHSKLFTINTSRRQVERIACRPTLCFCSCRVRFNVAIARGFTFSSRSARHASLGSSFSRVEGRMTRPRVYVLSSSVRFDCSRLGSTLSHGGHDGAIDRSGFREIIITRLKYIWRRERGATCTFEKIAVHERRRRWRGKKHAGLQSWPRASRLPLLPLFYAPLVKMAFACPLIRQNLQTDVD